jgi:BON domain
MASAARADGRADALRESLLELRFTENLNLTGRALDAEVVGDTAILNGSVRSEEDRALAERLVTETGIRQVDNRLTVEPPPEPKPDKNPALTSEEREERKRAAAARAREREQAAAPAPTPEPAAEPAPEQVRPVVSPFQTAPIR